MFVLPSSGPPVSSSVSVPESSSAAFMKKTKNKFVLALSDFTIFFFIFVWNKNLKLCKTVMTRTAPLYKVQLGAAVAAVCCYSYHNGNKSFMEDKNLEG